MRMIREPFTGVKRKALQRLQESKPVPEANQRERLFPSPHPLCPPALDGEPERADLSIDQSIADAIFYLM